LNLFKTKLKTDIIRMPVSGSLAVRPPVQQHGPQQTMKRNAVHQPMQQQAILNRLILTTSMQTQKKQIPQWVFVESYCLICLNAIFPP
jgi:hypothetical protein